jgi:hypothetical protein
MKWKTEKIKSGEKQVFKNFALLPTKLDDGYTVWLEYYWAEEVWDDGTTSTGFGYWKTSRTSTKNPNLPDTGTPVRRP